MKDDAAYSDLTANFEVLRKDVAQIMSAIGTLAEGQTRNVGARVSETVGDVTGTISDQAKQAKLGMESAGHEIGATLEKHPALALLIAFGVGVSLTLLSRSAR